MIIWLISRKHSEYLEYRSMNKMPSVPDEKNEKKSFKGRKEKDRIFLNLLLSFLIHILSLIHFATLDDANHPNKWNNFSNIQ